MSAIEEIRAERQRQIDVEGWTLEHDDSHRGGAIAQAAACYAWGDPWFGLTYMWPWSSFWWKPTDQRRNLIKAGALIVAEIERRDRLRLEALP